MAKEHNNMNNMMYCFYDLCHEAAAIIKVCVEGLQYRVIMGNAGCNRICV